VVTAIYGLLAGPFAVMVSDRLVSKRGVSGPYAPHDPYANKNLVLVTRDAVVSIGYTGLAYLGETPTDVAIAEGVLGEPAPGLSRLGGPGNLVNPDDLNHTIARVVDSLEARFRRMLQFHRDIGLQILMIGFRAREGEFPKPVVWHIANEPGAADVGIYRADHEVYEPWARQEPRFWPIGQVANNASRARVKAALETTPVAARDCEETLANDIRVEATDRPETVGRDLMRILIGMRTDGTHQVFVRYDPDINDSPDAYSPWVLTPIGYQVPAIAGPNVLSGSMNTGWGEVLFEYPPRGRATVSGWFPQPRPGPPR
jgi:hypothetical protein